MPLVDSFTFSSVVTSSSQVVVLQLPTTDALYPDLTDTYHVSTFTQLESLQATIRLSINNWPVAPLPETSFRDSEAEKQAKLMAVYDAFAKCGMKLLIDSGAGFVERAQIQIQNRGSETYLPLMQPYLCMTEVQLLGKADRIAVQMTDLGNGVLGAGDSILIQGSYKQERNCETRVVAVARLTYTGIYTPS